MSNSMWGALRHRRLPILAIGALALMMSELPLGSLAATGPGKASSSHKSQAVCPGRSAGVAQCDSWVVMFGNSASSGSPTAGLTAPQLEQAYALPSATAGGAQTVAIVDAYDDPNAVSDVSTYRSTFGLGACGSTASASGCTFTNNATIRKVSQTGTTSYPRANQSWAQEISLDLDMVSAICPKCNILLVEASTNSIANLTAAEDEGAALHATEISNSYGSSEFSGETADDVHYHHPGIAITASTGDSGYGVEWPAASPWVTAAGGTSLTAATNARGWTETAWSGAGSGCSAYEPALPLQARISALAAACPAHRAVADVSAVADPNTGVSVYDTYKGLLGRILGTGGWMVFGGTSVASPIIASVYALAGNASTVTDGSLPYGNPYGTPPSINDVMSGSNGSCGGSVLCTAGPGWDGPTGLGSPNGTGAF